MFFKKIIFSIFFIFISSIVSSEFGYKLYAADADMDASATSYPVIGTSPEKIVSYCSGGGKSWGAGVQCTFREMGKAVSNFLLNKFGKSIKYLLAMFLVFALFSILLEIAKTGLVLEVVNKLMRLALTFSISSYIIFHPEDLVDLFYEVQTFSMELASEDGAGGNNAMTMPLTMLVGSFSDIYSSYFGESLVVNGDKTISLGCPEYSDTVSSYIDFACYDPKSKRIPEQVYVCLSKYLQGIDFSDSTQKDYYENVFKKSYQTDSGRKVCNLKLEDSMFQDQSKKEKYKQLNEDLLRIIVKLDELVDQADDRQIKVKEKEKKSTSFWDVGNISLLISGAIAGLYAQVSPIGIAIDILVACAIGYNIWVWGMAYINQVLAPILLVPIMINFYSFSFVFAPLYSNSDKFPCGTMLNNGKKLFLHRMIQPAIFLFFSKFILSIIAVILKFIFSNKLSGASIFASNIIILFTLLAIAKLSSEFLSKADEISRNLVEKNVDGIITTLSKIFSGNLLAPLMSMISGLVKFALPVLGIAGFGGIASKFLGGVSGKMNMAGFSGAAKAFSPESYKSKDKNRNKNKSNRYDEDSDSSESWEEQNSNKNNGGPSTIKEVDSMNVKNFRISDDGGNSESKKDTFKKNKNSYESLGGNSELNRLTEVDKLFKSKLKSKEAELTAINDSPNLTDAEKGSRRKQIAEEISNLKLNNSNDAKKLNNLQNLKSNNEGLEKEINEEKANKANDLAKAIVKAIRETEPIYVSLKEKIDGNLNDKDSPEGPNAPSAPSLSLVDQFGNPIKSSKANAPINPEPVKPNSFSTPPEAEKPDEKSNPDPVKPEDGKSEPAEKVDFAEQQDESSSQRLDEIKDKINEYNKSGFFARLSQRSKDKKKKGVIKEGDKLEDKIKKLKQSIATEGDPERAAKHKEELKKAEDELKKFDNDKDDRLSKIQEDKTAFDFGKPIDSLGKSISDGWASLKGETFENAGGEERLEQLKENAVKLYEDREKAEDMLGNKDISEEEKVKIQNEISKIEEKMKANKDDLNGMNKLKSKKMLGDAIGVKKVEIAGKIAKGIAVTAAGGGVDKKFSAENYLKGVDVQNEKRTESLLSDDLKNERSQALNNVAAFKSVDDSTINKEYESVSGDMISKIKGKMDLNSSAEYKEARDNVSKGEQPSNINEDDLNKVFEERLRTIKAEIDTNNEAISGTRVNEITANMEASIKKKKEEIDRLQVKFNKDIEIIEINEKNSPEKNAKIEAIKIEFENNKKLLTGDINLIKDSIKVPKKAYRDLVMRVETLKKVESEEKEKHAELLEKVAKAGNKDKNSNG